MNPWDIDPSLYAAFWRMLREWYVRRQAQRSLPQPLTKPAPRAGCRA